MMKNLSKNAARLYTVTIVCILVFSVIAFALPTNKGTFLFWFAYVFGVFAIAIQPTVFKVSFAKGETAKSRFYGFPIATIGTVYLGVQIVASLIEIIFAKWLFPSIPIIINVLILAAFLLGLVAADTMRDEIEHLDDKLKKQVKNIRGIQSLSQAMVSQCEDAGTKNELSSLADELKYSDPVSCAESEALETELEIMLKDIQKALIDKDMEAVISMCGRAKSVLTERNRVCKLNK